MGKSPTRSGHIGGAGRLYLLDVPEFLLGQNLVKVGDDFIQEPKTLHPFVVRLQLHVELGKVGDGPEQDAHAVALLVVQFLPRKLCSVWQDGALRGREL